MASKLCCTADQTDRSASPDVPNARVSAATPNWPLLSNQAGSPHSQFTSARTEELCELRHIFDNAQHDALGETSPRKGPRPPSSRRSLYSLHSLHKMTSMRSILRRNFSRDLPRRKSTTSGQQQAAREAIAEHSDTVVKHASDDVQQQLQVAKDNLRKDLLSDKAPAEGGYDSDAHALDVVARNIAKATPHKRPSIHSVDWAPSSGSKSTPGSLDQHRGCAELAHDMHPYQIQQDTQPLTLSGRFTQVLSTPNLRADGANQGERRLRRSHSATSTSLPKPPSLSPLRLPSFINYEKGGLPWAEVTSESLRLCQFPVPPRHASLKPSKTSLAPRLEYKDGSHNHETEQVRENELDQNANGTGLVSSARAIEIRIQQPSSIVSPRPSTSVRRDFRENAPPVNDCGNGDGRDGDQDEGTRRPSVHLYSMRISHHLRSGSLLSWDQLADAPEIPSTPRSCRQRTVSDQSRSPQTQAQFARHGRQTSSSGFASNKVPSRWGRVLPNDRDLRADVASSIYSSRPHSPPDSSGGSMVNLSRTGSGYHNFTHSSVDFGKLRRSNSFPTDNEETPRPLRSYGMTNVAAAQDVPLTSSLLGHPPLLARKNSVADTKKSKFREEFSPSPPRKKLVPSTSIMKFLHPKRLSLRTLSEANLQPEASKPSVDGPFDNLALPIDRERRQSRSLISLQTEQEAWGKDKAANHVWDKALKAHQEEKASMFLPQNRELAVHASPFRERSGSCSSRRPSFQGHVDLVAETSNPKRFSAPMLAQHTFEDRVFVQSPELAARRSATAGRDALSPAQEVAQAFEDQGDDVDVVGAWGRYPSHTRADRTLYTGKKEHVETRDFALEAAIRFATAKANDRDDGDDMVDPIERLPSPSLPPGEKKRKKKIGTSKMVKSHSMTFGRKLIKNYYAGMFKSSSSEFRQHGRGHRSSIASGGTLEHPELELLPEVFMSDANDGAGGGPPARSDKQVVRRHSERHIESKTKGKLPIGDSMATLRPRRNSSAPNLNDSTNLQDGAGNLGTAPDRARVWSVYYEKYVPSFSKHSTDNDFALGGFGGPSRISCDSQHSPQHIGTMTTRRKHSRHASQLSRMSNTSRCSARSGSCTMGEDEDLGEDKSLVSVRRSTMDLISMFKEQENTEHARILSLTRAESRREAERLMTSV